MADSADPDRSLVDEAQRGSKEAVGLLVERHWRSSWRVARAITGDATSAEDVVQEALIAALLERATGRLPRPLPDRRTRSRGARPEG